MIALICYLGNINQKIKLKALTYEGYFLTYLDLESIYDFNKKFQSWPDSRTLVSSQIVAISFVRDVNSTR